MSHSKRHIKNKSHDHTIQKDIQDLLDKNLVLNVNTRENEDTTNHPRNKFQCRPVFGLVTASQTDEIAKNAKLRPRDFVTEAISEEIKVEKKADYFASLGQPGQKLLPNNCALLFSIVQTIFV